MTPKTPQGEVFCPLLSNSTNSGVPEDSKSPTLGVSFILTLSQSGVATTSHSVAGLLPLEEGANWYLVTLVLGRGTH
jgi:hypothetical protein